MGALAAFVAGDEENAVQKISDCYNASKSVVYRDPVHCQDLLNSAEHLAHTELKDTEYKEEMPLTDPHLSHFIDVTNLCLNICDLVDKDLRDARHLEFANRVGFYKKTLMVLKVALDLTALGTPAEQLASDGGMLIYESLRASLGAWEEPIAALPTSEDIIGTIGFLPAETWKERFSGAILFGRRAVKAVAEVDIDEKAEAVSLATRLLADILQTADGHSTWKGSLAESASWDEVVETSRTTLFLKRGLAGKLTKHTEQLANDLQSLREAQNFHEDMEGHAQTIKDGDTTLTIGNTILIEAMAIQIMKDIKKTKEEQATELQGVMDTLPEKEVKVSSLHPAVQDHINTITRM